MYICIYIHRKPRQNGRKMTSFWGAMGRHGQAGSWRGQWTGWIGSEPVQISWCGLLWHQLHFPTVQMSSTRCHNCTQWVHFKKREIINRTPYSDYLLFDRKTNWLLDSFFLNFKVSAKSHSFVYRSMYLFLRSKPDLVWPNADFSQRATIFRTLLGLLN